MPVIQNAGIGAVLDQPIRGNGERTCKAAPLARGDRDIGAIRPAGAQGADASDVLIAGGDVDELRMRLNDNVGAAGLDRKSVV